MAVCAGLAVVVAGCVPTEARSHRDGGTSSSASANSAAPGKKPSRTTPGKKQARRRADPGTRGRADPDRGALGRSRSDSGSSARPQPDRPGSAAEATALIGTVYRESFDGRALGNDWYLTSPVWRVAGGRLCAKGARNHPVWLRRRLPVNARIEFDATSSSSDGDIKAELWGDGQGAAEGVSYTNASSYLAIFGGWKNRFHVLARLDEHAPDRLQIKVARSGGDWRALPVQPNQTYHFKIERSDGRTVSWLVDDIELFNFTDPKPLRGPGHQHLGFNNWDVQVCFDNLIITPLED